MNGIAELDSRVRYFIKDNLVSIQNKLLEFELKISMLTTKKLTQKYKAKKMKRWLNWYTGEEFLKSKEGNIKKIKV